MTNDERIFERLGGIDAKLDGIYEQTKKTNGRVTALEGRMDEVDMKVAYAKGYSKGRVTILLALVSALAFVIGSIVVPIITEYLRNK